MAGVNDLLAINQTSDDGIATLVYPGTTDAIIAFYVRQGEQWTFKGVPDGQYEFKFTTGKDWNSETGQFDTGDGYWRADGQLNYSSNAYSYQWYSITLHEVDDGDVAKLPLSKNQFPDLSKP